MSEIVFKGSGEKALPFLKALDFHQNREWFLENKDIFEAHLYQPLGDLVDDLMTRFEKAGLPFRGDRKKSQFRIKRDTRFSKDKSPYNRHFPHCFHQMEGNGAKAAVSMCVSVLKISGLLRCCCVVAGEARLSRDAQGYCRQAGKISRNGQGPQE